MYFSLDNVYIFFSRRFFRKLYVYANCKTLHNADKYYNSYKKKKIALFWLSQRQIKPMIPFDITILSLFIYCLPQPDD